MKANTFSTINVAKSLRQRHPDAPPSVFTVGLVLATFADGKTGTSIRPGVDLVAEITGYHTDTVQDAIEWLVARGELRRDKKGYRGSAACFTWVGGMQGSHTPAIEEGMQGSHTSASDGMQGSHTPNAGVSDPSHLPDLDLEQPRHDDRTCRTDMRTGSSEDLPPADSGGFATEGATNGSGSRSRVADQPWMAEKAVPRKNPLRAAEPTDEEMQRWLDAFDQQLEEAIRDGRVPGTGASG